MTFLYHTIVGMGWAHVTPLLSETLLKAIFYMHSSLHVTASFLPFTVDVTGAISRVPSQTVIIVYVTVSL